LNIAVVYKETGGDEAWGRSPRHMYWPTGTVATVTCGGLTGLDGRLDLLHVAGVHVHKQVGELAHAAVEDGGASLVAGAGRAGVLQVLRKQPGEGADRGGIWREGGEIEKGKGIGRDREEGGRPGNRSVTAPTDLLTCISLLVVPAVRWRAAPCVQPGDERRPCGVWTSPTDPLRGQGLGEMLLLPFVRPARLFLDQSASAR
jgi:hypothetical protein